jgi:XTP/dITP diphosphohydrolase
VSDTGSTGAGRRLALASSNPHKLDELRRALNGWEIELLPLDGYPPETGATYAENAALKARFGHRHAGRGTWVIGEDSGIEADGLGGRPGVESARWAVDGIARLLAELEGSSDRRARYVCAILAVAPDGTETAAEGRLEGTIVTGPPRGDQGFGYDPIFVPEGETLTVAELGDAWKCEHSHRARAAAALARAMSA